MQKLKKELPRAGKARAENMRVVAIAALPDGQLDAYDGLDKRFDSGTSQTNIKKFIKIIGYD
jgi:hypothetical protein